MTNHKKLSKDSFMNMWREVKDNLKPDEAFAFLLNNKKKLEGYLSKIDQNNILYRIFHRFFSFFSFIAEKADNVRKRIGGVFSPVQSARVSMEKFSYRASSINFKAIVEFTRTKLYSLRRPHHNEKIIHMFEDVMEFCSSHGLDFNIHFPKVRKRYLEKKNQLLQHKFFQEFTKNHLEKILAIQFSFKRCIHPVLRDSAFWHKFFSFLEKIMVKDIFLFAKNGIRLSFKKSNKEKIQSSEVITILNRISALKDKGRRIFFIGHHEGYLGPYFVRSVVRKLGFGKLTKNCNTIIGPRMLSNVVLKNGASNVGNLFLTVPSQKTTTIETDGLADELKKTAKKTQCLIKLPNTALDLIQNLTYEEFMDGIVTFNKTKFEEYTAPMKLEQEKLEELKSCFDLDTFNETMNDLTKEDYYLFKSTMRECFLLFPEGSRSYIDSDGSILMKYVNPKYLEAYFRPGDYVVPVNLAGGSDLTKGWRLRPAWLGLSLGNPFEVTANMIENYKQEGLNIMRKISQLPNIKKVRFNEELYSS